MSDTLKFLYRQFFITPPATTLPHHNLQGQSGLVTAQTSASKLPDNFSHYASAA
ncbi:hypothetical protein GJ744_002597 [Endocarpon pusillum]|uniref:Uncharacterized protein n=1 Tax=Endocarpon pusillum TaxID=364733 RepID=A0A8H7E126_9EURO|nr:hypothetical protein GJ744_002597 [Endocarpon pusillum]